MTAEETKTNAGQVAKKMFASYWLIVGSHTKRGSRDVSIVCRGTARRQENKCNEIRVHG
jgi:hypothetical protein